MADTNPPTETKKPASLTQVFCAKTGYTPGDVWATNDRLRTVVTSNGGKYQLLKNGTVRVLKGPNYPKATE